MLDTGLAQDEPAPAVHRVQAPVYRAAIAVTMGYQPLARMILDEMRQTKLEDHDRAALIPELQRADDLEQML